MSEQKFYAFEGGIWERSGKLFRPGDVGLYAIPGGFEPRYWQNCEPRAESSLVMCVPPEGYEFTGVIRRAMFEEAYWSHTKNGEKLVFHVGDRHGVTAFEYPILRKLSAAQAGAVIKGPGLYKTKCGELVNIQRFDAVLGGGAWIGKLRDVPFHWLPNGKMQGSISLDLSDGDIVGPWEETPYVPEVGDEVEVVGYSPNWDGTRGIVIATVANRADVGCTVKSIKVVHRYIKTGDEFIMSSTKLRLVQRAEAEAGPADGVTPRQNATGDGATPSVAETQRPAQSDVAVGIHNTDQPPVVVGIQNTETTDGKPVEDLSQRHDKPSHYRMFWAQDPVELRREADAWEARIATETRLKKLKALEVLEHREPEKKGKQQHGKA